MDARHVRRAAPHFGARRWLNYLGDDQADDAIRAAYGPNYDRLVEVKRRYDPDNVFHLNHNIVAVAQSRSLATGCRDRLAYWLAN